jgi:hypothetical protein
MKNVTLLIEEEKMFLKSMIFLGGDASIFRMKQQANKKFSEADGKLGFKSNTQLFFYSAIFSDLPALS